MLKAFNCLQRLRLCAVADFEILNYQITQNYEQRTELK